MPSLVHSDKSEWLPIGYYIMVTTVLLGHLTNLECLVEAYPLYNIIIDEYITGMFSI